MASELALEAQNEVDVKEKSMTAQEMAQHAHESLRTMAQRLQTTAAAAARSPAGRFIGGAAAEAARHCGDRARTALAKLSRGDDEDRWRHADAITRGERWLTLTWYEKALVEEDKKGDSVLNGDEAAYARAAVREQSSQASRIDGHETEAVREGRRHRCQLAIISLC